MMKIDYICHSALFIETPDCKILADPWLKGAAYCNQWHLFPKPVNTELARQADVILVSHGHEDHLHHESLLDLNKQAKFFYPFQWQKGIKEYLGSLGFKDVQEAVSHKAYKIGNSTYITFIANSLDSIMVIESGGEVLVNINDALPASHKNIIKAFLEKIKAKWPKIDYLFCGYGSAAYFPNTVHCEGKDDLEVAKLREQLFSENFCYIVDELKPGAVVPFAADYVLLNEGKRWINHVKLSKQQIQTYYELVHKGGKVNFLLAQTGDKIENGKLQKLSPFHELEKQYSLDELINRELGPEIASVNNVPTLEEKDVPALQKAMTENVKRRATLFTPALLSRIRYTIHVTNLEDQPYFFVDCSGSEVKIERRNTVDASSILVLETTSIILDYCFASEWGGDAIIIGYGAEINILDKSIIGQSLDIICVRLLTNQPVASKQMKASPIRALKYLMFNPLTTSWAVKQALAGRNKVNKNPVNERSLWLSKSKCEICQVCDIPLLTEDFGESLSKA